MLRNRHLKAYKRINILKLCQAAHEILLSAAKPRYVGIVAAYVCAVRRARAVSHRVNAHNCRSRVMGLPAAHRRELSSSTMAKWQGGAIIYPRTAYSKACMARRPRGVLMPPVAGRPVAVERNRPRRPSCENAIYRRRRRNEGAIVVRRREGEGKQPI